MSKITPIKSRLFPALLAFLFILSFDLRNADAQNSAKYYLKGSYTSEQRQLVQRAVSLAVTRMQDERIRRTLYSSRSLYYISANVIGNSNMNNTEKNRKNLLWNQLYWLSRPNGPNDIEDPFPSITINFVNDPNGRWAGRAWLDLVKVFWNTSVKEWQQKGAFSISLNSAFVARRDLNPVYGSADYWAGTIAHEMLHNLGHTHGDYYSDGNYHSYQVNVFDRLVAGNGYEASALPGPSGGSRLAYGCDVK